ncbi:MAG: hypothetical protein GY821_17965 [Gammaproteobacteria bacterium]|nr:hypothetical protein [Gammaproteobacteria bacterium]
MNELALIANDIPHEHTLAVSNARTAIEHAHKAGELLTQAKKNVNHGEWGIKSTDEFFMIHKKNIQDIYGFLYIPKPDINKNYWEQ